MTTENNEQAQEQASVVAAEQTAKEEQANPLLRTIEFTVSRQLVQTEADKKLRAIAKKAKFHGFRPGKAPRHMVQAAYGQEAFMEALNLVVSEEFPKALEASGYRMVGAPEIVPAAENADPEQMKFEASFEVYPDVKTPDLSASEVTRYSCEVTDADIEKTIKVMREQRAQYEEAQKAAADTDMVTVDFEGRLDGTPFEGGSAKDYAFVLGAGRMLPEFENAVLGMNPGETKTFELTFPAEYGSAEIAGKTAEFDVTLKKVSVQKLPALDDAFAASLGVSEGGIDKLLADIKDNLTREVKARVEAQTKQSAMGALLAAADFALPTAMVEQERQTLVHNAVESMRARGAQIDEKKVPADAMRAEAEKRVRLGLVMAQILNDQKIEVSEDEERAEAAEIAKSYEDPKEVIDWYMNNKERRSELRMVVAEQKVVDYVLTQAIVKDEALDFDKLMAARP